MARRPEGVGFSTRVLSRSTKENGATITSKAKALCCTETDVWSRETSELVLWRVNPNQSKPFQWKKLKEFSH